MILGPNPVVSVCIPAYNSSELLVRAVESVFKQTLSNFELIITDDSPDDRLLSALQPWSMDIRFRYFKNKSRLGSPANWNRAMELARSNLIKFLHHDDWFSQNDSLEIFYKAISDESGHCLAFSQSNNVAENMIKSINAPSEDQIAQLGNNAECLMSGNFIGAPSATIFRYKKNFTFDENLKWLVDIDSYINLLSSGASFKYIKAPLVNIQNDHQDQVTNIYAKDAKMRIIEEFYMHEKYFNKSISQRYAWIKLRTREIGALKLSDIFFVAKKRIGYKVTIDEIIVLASWILVKIHRFIK